MEEGGKEGDVKFGLMKKEEEMGCIYSFQRRGSARGWWLPVGGGGRSGNRWLRSAMERQRRGREMGWKWKR